MFGIFLTRFTAAIEAGDAEALGAMFSSDGVYHDAIYGEFRGPDEVARMFREHWFRDGERYRWEMLEPVFDGRLGYVNWLFSYNLTNPDRHGRILMEGVSQLLMAPDGRVDRYREWAEGGGALLRAGAPQERLNALMFQHDDRVRARPDAGPHLAF